MGKTVNLLLGHNLAYPKLNHPLLFISFKFSHGNLIFSYVIGNVLAYRLVHFGYMPQNTYKLLGMEHLPWDRVDVCLGDERWVEETNKANNRRSFWNKY